MKIIFLFAILSIYSIDLYSKYILENFELVKSFKIKSNIIKTKDITYQDSNLIYLTKNNIKVFLHNYNSNTLDTFLTLNQFPTDKIDGFDISKDKYLVSLVNYLFVVDKIPIDSLSNDNTKYVQKETSYNKKIINNKYFMYNSDFGSGKWDKNTQTLVEIYNLNNNVLKFLDFPNPSSLEFSFFTPIKLMDINKKEVVAIADNEKYKINFYNLDKRKIDSLEYNHNDWVKYDGEFPKYKIGDRNPAKFIGKMRPYLYKTSLIRGIDYLNDSTLLVNWTIPNKPNKRFDNMPFRYFFDIWEKSNNKWNLKDSNLIDFKFSDFDEKGQENIILNDYSIHISNDYTVKDGYLIFTSICNIDIFNNNIGKKYKEYQKELNNYFLENELETVVYIYKFKE